VTIQFSQVLLVAALILFVIYIFRLRTAFLDRLVYIACAAVGAVFVIDPPFSTQIANLLGIGRGADLLFYLFIITSLFYAVETRSRLRRMEQQLTKLVRQNALDHPVEGESHRENHEQHPDYDQ
jgi:hypothetical protein